jgi:hypothetical protein
MKKLIYVDNDNEKRALEDLENILSKMELFMEIPLTRNDFTIIDRFWEKKRDNMFEVFFNPENVIIDIN